jgi:uncharacterized protein YjbJ (UPF0337 family)
MSGKSDQAKGRAKEAGGSLTGDDSMKNEGKVDRTSGDAKEKLSGAVDKIKNTFKGKK